MRHGSMLMCLLVLCASAHAATPAWQPAAGHVQMPIWPGAAPDLQPMPGAEYGKTDPKSQNDTVVAAYNVSQPTMTVYAAKGKNTGAAVVVFPGGGFQMLAMALEGTRDLRLADLERHHLRAVEISRAERALRLALRLPSAQFRSVHAVAAGCATHDGAGAPACADWHIDPHKVGVHRFFGRRISGGGNQHACSSIACTSPWTPPTRKTSGRISPWRSIPGISRTDDGKFNSNDSGHARHAADFPGAGRRRLRGWRASSRWSTSPR